MEHILRLCKHPVSSQTFAHSFEAFIGGCRLQHVLPWCYGGGFPVSSFLLHLLIGLLREGLVPSPHLFIWLVVYIGMDLCTDLIYSDDLSFGLWELFRMRSCAHLICCCLFLSISFLSGTARCSEVVFSLPLSLFEGALLPAGTVLTSWCHGFL